MSPLARRVARLLAGYAVLGALAWLLALPLWYAAHPARRPVVVRVAAGAILAIALAQVLSAASRRVDAQPPSPFDAATAPFRDEPSLPREFRELHEEVRFGRASQGYWTRVLRPRLHSLGQRLPAGADLPEPALSGWRRLLGLGPSLSALRDLLARLEARG